MAQGRSWSDGTSFSADDVKFTFDYIIKHAGALGAQAYFLTDYHSSEVVDGDLILTMATGNYTAMKTVCNSIPIIPLHIWQSIREPGREKNLSPVGTGNYFIAEGDYIEGSSITATRRADCPGSEVDSISVILMGSEDVLINALDDGSIDLMLDPVSPAKAHALSSGGYPNVKISSVPGDSVTTLLFNVGPNGRLREYPQEVRRAISLAIDQQALIDQVLHGMGVPVGDGLVQEQFAHAYVDELDNYVHHKTNVDTANALLDAASYPMDEHGSRGISLKIFATPGDEVMVKALAAQLEQIGIAIEYEQASATYSEEIKQQNHADFDMIINRVTFTADKLLMFNARYGVYPGTETVRLFNYSGIIDHTLIAMMDAMERAADTREQYRLCREVQAYLAALTVEIPLYSENTITLYSEMNWTGWADPSIQSLRRVGQ